MVDNDKVINAWCMPGGKIAVYTGLLKITKNSDALSIVMGHEIAHAVARHSLERMSSSYDNKFRNNCSRHFFRRRN